MLRLSLEYDLSHIKSDLAANAQVGIRDELWLLVAMLFHERVQHAHSNAR